jgi:predicted phage tail protein
MISQLHKFSFNTRENMIVAGFVVIVEYAAEFVGRSVVASAGLNP